MTFPTVKKECVLVRPDVEALCESQIRQLANDFIDQKDIIPFWFGESDQKTPAFICEAAISSIQSGETFYQQNLGRPYLREELARYLRSLHGTDFSSDNIAVMSSGISAIMTVCQAIISPNDKVIAITPVWQNLSEVPRILGAKVEGYPLTIDKNHWSLDLSGLLAVLTPEVKMLIINSPGNPTGWMIKDYEIDRIITHCRKNDIWVMSDDVYQRLVEDEAILCAPSFIKRLPEYEKLISINSFSKAWLMTGFRVGWITASPAVIKQIGKLIEFNTCCIFEPCQRAAQAALLYGEPVILQLRQELKHKKELARNALKSIPGIEIPYSGGGMYLFFRVSGYSDTLVLARDLVEQCRVGVAPGDAFGPEGKGWIRICVAVSDDKIIEGTSRIQRYFASPASTNLRDINRTTPQTLLQGA